MKQFFQQPVVIVAFIAAFASAALLWLAINLRMKWERHFGKQGLPEGDLLKELIQKINESKKRLDDMEPVVAELGKITKVSVQKVGFLRFNPFHDTGGDQSFALALLDQENNGVVISSLYAREGNRVYAKEISGGRPKQALSDEEKQVLDEAINKNL